MLGKISQNLEGLSPQRKFRSTAKEHAAGGIKREFTKVHFVSRRTKHLTSLD
jgi:hypothetical protein